MFELTLEKSKSSFQVSVGEEGAVIVYTKDGKVQTRLFLRTTEPHDTQKLVQLMAADSSAQISLYLDTMDQSYLQRTVVGVRAFSVNSIAQTQLDYEVPKNYLKTYISICRSQNKREDWIYTFVAAAYEQPLYKWVEFFTQYGNVIEGIYFLPVELSSAIKLLRPEKKIAGWEILICQNKTGGFRQSAFFNDKIILSRILKNIYDPDQDVMAGNIEQAVANATDHIKQLDIYFNAPITVYIILSQEIAKSVRLERIKADFIEILTPYQAALRLGVADMTRDKDKFFDPVFLAYSAIYQGNKNRMHIPQTAPTFKFMAFIYLVKKALQVTIPVLLVFTLVNLYSFFIDQLAINELKNKTNAMKVDIAEKQAKLDNLDHIVQDSLPIKQVSEIIDLDKFMNTANDSPITIMLKLSEIIPDYIRVKNFKWAYFDPSLPRFKTAKLNDQIDITEPRDYKASIALELVFANTGVSYKDLQARYTKFVASLQNRFPDAQLSIDNLPDISNIAAYAKDLSLTVRFTISQSTFSTRVK